MPATIMSSTAALSLLSEELGRAAERTALRQEPQLRAFIDQLLDAPRIFVYGAGRSGLALKMTAMRLMHLGLAVHVVGDVTTPAIARGDLLLAASGSGRTPSVLRAAERAAAVGATIAVLTTDPTSPLATIADVMVEVAAAPKHDTSDEVSRQYAGSLFEQGIVVIGDALFHCMWQSSNAAAAVLWERHANLE